jgi:oligopeptidase B
VAKLRAANTGDAPVLLRVNMDAGHGGRSGRFRRHHQTALEYAFLIDLAGVAEVLPAG